MLRRVDVDIALLVLLPQVVHTALVTRNRHLPDGDIVRLPLPGGLMTYFSGIGIFSPPQTVGVRLDVEVKNTVESLQAGRNLVLEKPQELTR